MKSHFSFSKAGQGFRNPLLCFWFGLLAAYWPAQALGQANYATPYTFTTLAGYAGYGSADGTGRAALFSHPGGITMDGAGNLYVADSGNSTIRKLTPSGTNWVVTTFAGLADDAGTNNGAGSSALFDFPTGMAIDNNTNIYVGDTDNDTIREITPAGVVTTLAGQPGITGTNNGTGAAALFNDPYGVAADNAGNVYVADSQNDTIRKMTLAEGGWTVSTLAGLAMTNGSANGTNSAARFKSPLGVAVNAAGDIFVADTFNNTIRQVTPAGVVTTIAGLAGTVGSANGTNSVARFNGPTGLASDIAGNIYVADYSNDTIRVMSPVGTNWVVKTLAGLAGSAGSVDGSNSVARFNFPVTLTVDASSNVYVADFGNSTIRKISPVGTNWVVTTLAGLADGAGTNNGTGFAAQFIYPSGAAVDTGGNVYVADEGNDEIRKVTPAGVVTTLAGAAGLTGTNNGTGSAARFYYPAGVALDGATNVYVADYFNDAIRKVTPAGVVTTIAGYGGLAGTNNGIGSAARFYQPFGVAVDGQTNVYVADTYNQTIRKITEISNKWTVTTLAGTPGTQGSQDGTNSKATFNLPIGIAVDNASNIYVADYFGFIIRRISPKGSNWVVTTIAGVANVPGNSDGTNSGAGFYYPAGLALEGAGDLYVADLGNDTVRKMTPSGTNWIVTTLAGMPDTSGNANGTASAVRFNGPFGMAVDSAGNVYVADSDNDAIRKGYPASSVPLPVLGVPGLGEGQIGFGISGLSGSAVDIESSSNLVQWQTLGTGYILYGGTNYFIDPTAPPAIQFYRAHVR